MSLFGKIFGNPAGGILDDKAERTLARRLGFAANVIAWGAAVMFILIGLSCVRCGG